jgi:hypothetical protein
MLFNRAWTILDLRRNADLKVNNKELNVNQYYEVKRLQELKVSQEKS